MPAATEPPIAGRLNVLHVSLSGGHTSAPYNDYAAPLSKYHDIKSLVYFPAQGDDLAAPQFVSCDGTVRGFFRGLRKVNERNSFDVVHLHSVHVGVLFLLWACVREPRLLTRTVVTLHTSFPLLSVRNRLLLFLNVLFIRRIVCCSRSSARSLPRVLLWTCRRRLRTIPNAVNLDRVDAQYSASHRASDAGRSIISVGRLTKGKRPDVVLAGFARMPTSDATLTFVGDGPLLDELRRQAEDLNCERRVEFAGLVDRNEVLRRLARADVFVSMSKGEGLPVAVLEAMACGCLIVLSRIAPHEEITEGLSSIPLLDAQNTEDLAIAMSRMLELPERTRVEERCRIRSHVREHFPSKRLVSEYDRLYRGLCASREIRASPDEKTTHRHMRQN